MSPVSCLVSHVSCSHVPSTVPNYAKLFQTKQKQATVHAPEALHDLVVSLLLSPQIYVFLCFKLQAIVQSVAFN